MYRFEKLEVWKLAIEYAEIIYAESQQFPSHERFGLTSQIRRAAVSISSNVAEGSSRRSNRDFARFVEIAYGSVLETVSLGHIARRLAYLSEASFKPLDAKSERLSRMLSGLSESLLRDPE